MYEKRDRGVGWAPKNIRVLREKLCADFLRTGNFDPATIEALTVYAKSVRGNRSDARKKNLDDISVRPIGDSIAVSPKYAAYLVRQRAIADRDNRGGPDEPLIGSRTP